MILGRHRKPAPRLAAELDDTELGTVCRRLAERGAGHTRVLVAPLVQRLLDVAGDDWNRRAPTRGPDRVHAPEHSALLGAARLPAPPTHTPCSHGEPWHAAPAHHRTTPSSTRPDEAVGACVTAARLRPHDPNPWVVRLGLR